MLSALAGYCSTQSRAQLRAHLMDLVVAVNPMKTPTLRIVVDQRQGIAQIHLDAILHDLASVVRALMQRFATGIAYALDVRLGKTLVVGCLAHGTHPAAGESFDEYWLRNIQIQRCAHGRRAARQTQVERFGLGSGAWEPVQEHTSDGVSAIEALNDHLNHQLVRHEVAAFHVPWAAPPSGVSSSR